MRKIENNLIIITCDNCGSEVSYPKDNPKRYTEIGYYPINKDRHFCLKCYELIGPSSFLVSR